VTTSQANPDPVLTLSALSDGPEASGLADARGRVTAVVSKALYLECESSCVVALVDPALPEGPITVRVAGLAGALPALKGSVRASFHGNGSHLEIGGRLRLDLTRSRPWIPPAITIEAAPAALNNALDLLSGVIAGQREVAGLGPLSPYLAELLDGDEGSPESAILDPPDPPAPLLRVASRALRELGRAWHGGDSAAASTAALRFLGLGPGLTPSGDDLLMGLLAVCRWSESYSERAALMGPPLAKRVLEQAPTATTRISARLLAHASNGLLYEPAMTLAACLFSARIDRIEPAASRLFAIGHSSGTDMALGILVGARLSLRK
jgi:hypothetical protein